MLRPRTLPHDPVDSRQFEVAVRRLANSLDFGQRDSVFHGAGLEYVQSRPYVAGDAVKFIDWKISARLGKLYVKEFKETKQIPLYLLLDTSASMCVSSQPLSKYAWAVRVATGIGLAAQSSVTPVGLLGCGARELHIRPTLSRNIVMEWAHQLRQHDFTEVTSLSARARELAPSLAKRTTVVVLSDLLLQSLLMRRLLPPCWSLTHGRQCEEMTNRASIRERPRCDGRRLRCVAGRPCRRPTSPARVDPVVDCL